MNEQRQAGVRHAHQRRGSTLPTWMAAGIAASLVLSPGTSVSAQRAMAASGVVSAPTGRDAAGLEPGDVVRLRIWREPDMSGDYPVDARGFATFPRLGSMLVTSVSADSLQRLLVTEYTKYLKNPSVEIVVLRRVRVVGAVKTPGVYTVDPTMRVRDVLALAGGASAEGKTNRVRLDRDGTSRDIDLSDTAHSNEETLRSGDQLYVPQRGWFARNTPLVAAIVSVSGGLLFALVAR